MIDTYCEGLHVIGRSSLGKAHRAVVRAAEEVFKAHTVLIVVQTAADVTPVAQWIQYRFGVRELVRFGQRSKGVEGRVRIDVSPYLDAHAWVTAAEGSFRDWVASCELDSITVLALLPDALIDLLKTRIRRAPR